MFVFTVATQYNPAQYRWDVTHKAKVFILENDQMSRINNMVYSPGINLRI